MSASIIVPVYNALDYARACIGSLYVARSSTRFEIVVVNNGSDPEVREWLDEERKCRPNLRALHFDEPLGFARAVNEGARVARHGRIVPLNSDTLVTIGWLDALTEVLDDNPRVGIASPVTNACGHDVQADPDAAGVTSENADAYAEIIAGRREVVFEPQRLVFFCAMIRRSLWEQLAGLDEGYVRGNFEDDDFCLRARLLGYRLAVVRRSFVFHHERQTFTANQIDHGESMMRNQARFCDRASRWARSPAPRPNVDNSATDLTVIVPVPSPDSQRLDDSLQSLVNQTAGGFEVLVVSATDAGKTLAEFDGRLRLKVVAGEPGDGVASLLNRGLDATGSRRVAFLPAGDLYFPFHLEVLLRSMDDGADSAYTAWAFEVNGRMGAVRFDQASPERLALGDWSPIVSWMCANPSRLPRLDESLGSVAGWDFTLRMVRDFQPRYLRRLTCQKQTATGLRGAEVRRVMDNNPVPGGGAWHDEERRQFLRAVESGCWETALIFGRNEVERRARRMLAPQDPLSTDAREIRKLRTRLMDAAARVEASEPAASTPDVILFNIIGWTHLTQRPHHFARGLAARGHRVFWVDVQLRDPSLADSASLTRRLEPNLFYVELPAVDGELYRLRWTRPAVEAMDAAFHFLRSAFSITTAVQLVNFPKWTPLLERLRDSFGWPVVYDCLDNQQAFGELHRNSDVQYEERLARDAALVITSGRTLFESQSARGPNTVLIPNAADFRLFSESQTAGLLEDLPRPVIGFFGAFSEWLDRDWIAEAAKRFPDWSFVYIGRPGFARGPSRRGWTAATSARNITVLPQVDLPTLAQYLAEFDVCTMPFRDLAITRSMNAVKLFEYLAAGKPVVAPDLPETRPLAEEGLISVYRTWDESFALLERAVAEGNREADVERRRAFASANTWEHRVDQLIEVLQRAADSDRPRT